MNNIEVLQELDKRDLLKPLIVGGIVPVKVLTYLEMFYQVDAQIKAGVQKKTAICNTCIFFNVSERTVWNALKSLK